MVKREYYVVLRHGDINTMHYFNSKTQFRKWFPKFKNIHEIVEEGISKKRAIDLSTCIDNDSQFAKDILNEK